MTDWRLSVRARYDRRRLWMPGGFDRHEGYDRTFDRYEVLGKSKRK
jgi:hypothetical protein